jgi:hypothetical protein
MQTIQKNQASESHVDLTLDAALRVMAPMVKLLLNEGVTYTRFTNALKKSFLEAAPSVLESSGSKVNDSSLSTLTGIHRKDVREWRTVGEPLPQAKSFSAVMAVFTRWANDPEFCDKKGHPKILDRLGSTGTFESLASKVTNDVRPLALLQEMIRLGVASKVTDDDNAETDKVRLCMEALVPKQGSAELLQLFSDNVGDHLAAAVHNLSRGADPMLEQSIYADNLRPESVAEINALSRKIWTSAFQTIVSNATVLSDKDEGQAGANQRLRVGMYFYHGSNLEP